MLSCDLMTAAAKPAFVALPPVKHLRLPASIHFPDEAMRPEGSLHLFLRVLLQRIIHVVLGDAHTVGSEHFVYWNARDPRRCLSPDVFVKLGVAETWYRSWKTWEQGGPPELAVEIVSSEQAAEPKWDEKLLRYHELGVKELVRFDADAAEGRRLRVWDRIHDDLVERVVERDQTTCLTLRLVWVVRPTERAPITLRLMDANDVLLPTPDELERARAAEERARAAEERARADRLEARLRALGVDPDD